VLDIASELYPTGIQTGIDPQATFRSFLENQGFAGIPGAAAGVLQALAGIGPGGAGVNIADPESAEGQGRLFGLAQAAAPSVVSPLFAGALGRTAVRQGLADQFADLLLQGGQRPSFAGFLANRIGLPGTVG
jgi:hypothetical protein